MAYIGNTADQQAFTPAVDFFSGNGITTAFTLSRPVASVAQVQATIENVPQNPGTAFTVSGNTITFDGAPASGTNNIYVYYTSPITQVIQPGQGTVGTAQMANGLTVNFADGSASAPSITNDGDTNTGMFFPAADTIAFTEGGVEGMRITSTGDIGIGTTTPYSSNGTNVEISDSLIARLLLNQTGTRRWSMGAGSNAINIYDETADAERFKIDASGNLCFNSGYGATTIAYGCRAWVNFNGTTSPGTIRASGNVSSVTKNAGGDYTVNFTAAMPDINYSANFSGNGPTLGDYNNQQIIPYTNTPTTGAIRMLHKDNNAAGAGGRDCVYGFVAIYR